MTDRRQTEQTERNWSRRDLFRAGGTLAVGGLALSAFAYTQSAGPNAGSSAAQMGGSAAPAATASAAAIAGSKLDAIVTDPTVLPAPIRRNSAVTHEVTLTCEEIEAEIESGVSFRYMTFGGQVPGPLIRVRQGDTVRFRLENAPDSRMVHNIDFHAVYGTGGGAEATNVQPDQSNGMVFQARYPGAFIYHCAVPNLDQHISCGMFGMIVVEPPEGLPPVDREFYLGQHEVYTDKPTGEKGRHNFNFEAMAAETPNYVLLQGAKTALTANRVGPLKANVGETARVFLVNGGPNLTSNFHPIGNVWTKAWREGAIASNPERYVQTMAVPPGSCGIFEMEFPVPETVKLVDHALSRVARKGMLGEIKVEGEAKPEIFDANPGGESGSKGEGGY
ncbi:MAG: copper-containing nitrite reductase [Candidatus Bipolaricaulia bacterium]